MSARNRSKYASESSFTVKNIAIATLGILGVGAFSFLLGFFVLARLVPGGQKIPEQPGASAVPVTPAESRASSASPPQTAANPAPRQTVVTAPPAPVAGPSIDPGDDSADKTQPAGSPDDTVKPVRTSGSRDSAETQTSRKIVGTDDSPNVPTKPGDESTLSITPPDANTPVKAPITPRRRRHKTSTSDVQTSTMPDAPNETAPPANDTTASKDTVDIGSKPAADDVTRAVSAAPPLAASGDKKYRVQLGVYSTRAEADILAQRANSSGVSVSVHAVKKGGVTLYRVQQGVYRSKTAAQAAGKRLSEKGFDVYVADAAPKR